MRISSNCGQSGHGQSGHGQSGQSEKWMGFKLTIKYNLLYYYSAEFWGYQKSTLTTLTLTIVTTIFAFLQLKC